MALTQFDVDQQAQTLRQQALNNVVNGIGSIEQAAKTKRAQALENQEMAMKYQAAGYKVTPDQVAKARDYEAPGMFAKMFGAKEEARPDLLAERTDAYKAKVASDAEEKKFKRKMDETDMAFKQDQMKLDRQFKTAQMGNMLVDNEKKIAEMNDLKTGNKFKRELTQKQMQDIGAKNANLLGVKNAMDSALAQLDDEKLSEEAKIKVGQGLLKLLNSAEGSDAVGAEEAKRIGSYLEHKMFNVFEPGSMFGRDLDLFTDQVRNNANLLTDRIKKNESAIGSMGQGFSMSQIVDANPTPSGDRKDIALQPVNFRGQDPKVNFAPTKIPNASPIQNANAGNPGSVKPQHFQKAKQMSDQELMDYLGIK